jgi:hypothetical protein
MRFVIQQSRISEKMTKRRAVLSSMNTLAGGIRCCHTNIAYKSQKEYAQIQQASHQQQVMSEQTNDVQTN